MEAEKKEIKLGRNAHNKGKNSKFWEDPVAYTPFM
jgi:hypothetical protein